MDLNNISSIIAQYATLMLIIITIISITLLFIFKQKSRYIPIFLIVSLFVEIGNTILGKLYDSNLILIPLFSLFDYFLWSRFFTPKRSKHRKKIIWIDVLVTGFVIIELYTVWTSQRFLIIPSFSFTSLAILYVMIRNYIKVFKIETTINVFIFSLVLMYSLLNCFFGLFVEFFVYWDDDFKFFMWIGHSILLYLFYLLLPYYQWRIGKNTQHFLFGQPTF